MSRSMLKPMLALAALPLLAACSAMPWSHPAPKGNPMADADEAIRIAERARVGDYDAAGLRTAKHQLELARALAADPKRKELANWMAQEAVADSELTIARAQRARIFAYYDDLKRRLEPPAPVTPAPETPVATPTTNGEPTP